MNTTSVFTDGSCIGNPGPGGWAFAICKGPENDVLNMIESYVLEHNQKLVLKEQDRLVAAVYVGSGADVQTTNSRMELKAVSEALRVIKGNEAHFYVDSEYVVNSFNKGWLESWLDKGGVKANGTQVAHWDLWNVIVYLINGKHITWHHVSAHTDNTDFCSRMNDFVDKLAYKVGKNGAKPASVQPPSTASENT